MNSQIINHSDPRIVKTKKQFKEAFKQLLLIYDDFMSITVKELCDKAGLSRKTFYLHYNQVDELLLEIQEDFIKDFYMRTKDLDFLNDAEQVVKVYFDMSDNDPICRKMATSSVYFFTKEMSRKMTFDYFESKGKIVNNGLDGAILNYCVFFYDMTVYTMYKRWKTIDSHIEKEQIISLTADLLKNGISSLNINKKTGCQSFVGKSIYAKDK